MDTQPSPWKVKCLVRRALQQGSTRAHEPQQAVRAAAQMAREEEMRGLSYKRFGPKHLRGTIQCGGIIILPVKNGGIITESLLRI